MPRHFVVLAHTEQMSTEKTVSGPLRIPSGFRDKLRCPVCRSVLLSELPLLKCAGAGCQREFVVHDGIPVLLNPGESLFSAADALRPEKLTQNIPESALAGWKRFLPTLDYNLKGERNLRVLVQTFRERRKSNDPIQVLIIGGRVAGKGMSHLNDFGNDFEILHTDVVLGPEVQALCDGHDLPFADQSIDCIVVQAVLEHVLDPWRCVAEIHRVLRPAGIVYAETPFMQQGHMGAYDFTRFTHLGHRNLFRNFSEIESGAVCGPGMALGWSYQYFLCSFASSRRSRRWFSLIARCTGFFFKYFDYWLINKPGTIDSASAFYFIGAKSDHALESRLLVKQYRGISD